MLTLTDLIVDPKTFFIIVFTEKELIQLDKTIHNRDLMRQVDLGSKMLLQGKIRTLYVSKQEGSS